MSIQKLAILGGGTMGRGIAHTFARFGYKVNIYEPFEEVRIHIIDKISDELNFLIDEKYICSESLETAVANISLYSDLEEALNDVDYVLEASPEIIELKQQLFENMEKYCPKHTIFSTNTSSLRLSDITAKLSTNAKKRAMVCHWYNPPYLIPIVELSKFGNMSEEDFRSVYDLHINCGKQPVRVLKDIPGMIANRLLHALAREVFYLSSIGATTNEDLDKALKYGPCFRNATTGMFEVADMGGLDVWLAAEDNLFPHLCNDDKASDALREQVDAGHLGLKNGRGFFEYSDIEKGEAQNKFYKRLLVQLKASENY